MNYEYISTQWTNTYLHLGSLHHGSVVADGMGTLTANPDGNTNTPTQCQQTNPAVPLELSWQDWSQRYVYSF